MTDTTSPKKSREQFVLRSLLDVSTAVHRLQVQVIDMQMAQQSVSSPPSRLRTLLARATPILRLLRYLRIAGTILTTTWGQALLAMLGALVGEAWKGVFTRAWRWLWSWVQWLSSAGLT